MGFSAIRNRYYIIEVQFVKNENRKLRLISYIIMALILIPAACRKNAKQNPDIKMIMNKLNADLSGAVTAFHSENYAELSRRAIAIADHPKVPLKQRKIIAGELKEEMQEFKKYDVAVHSAALLLKKAASDKNDAEIPEYISTINKNCHGCHVRYRKRIRNLLRGK